MTAELIGEEGILKGLILYLDTGDEWTLGRDPDQSEITLEDPKISRRHASVTKRGDDYYLENLSESNPVLVNGLAVAESTRLKGDDLLTLGGTIFRFLPKGAEGISFRPTFEETATAAPIPFEETEEETIFEEGEASELSIDLTPQSRFFLKVITGPNAGAEFGLETGREYLIGTDPITCDIVFNDLSVSREHARLSLSEDGGVIEDLNSRNGVVIERERIYGKAKLRPNTVAALGTTAFLLIDREAPAETIAAPVIEQPPLEEEVKIEEAKPPPALGRKLPFRTGSFILSIILAGLILFLGIGVISLFQTHELEPLEKDYLVDLQTVMNEFPGIRYTFNKSTGKLFLTGHVESGVRHNELLYKLRGLPFIKGVEDNLINDEAVWQEMNILLSKHPDFKGVSMHSPAPGVFVLNGYLRTEQQASALTDYMNLHFNYLSGLQNRVIVESDVMDEVTSRLLQYGINAVTIAFSNGEMQLTGYVSTTQAKDYERLLKEFQDIPGVRMIKNFVVVVSPEQGVVDLNKRYPGRYVVTGSSKHGEVNINVVINGKIYSRGDRVDGMVITSIQPRTIFLEKDGLKYKIEYNK